MTKIETMATFYVVCVLRNFESTKQYRKNTHIQKFPQPKAIMVWNLLMIPYKITSKKQELVVNNQMYS